MKSQAAPFEKYLNLADARLGTRALFVSDDWFAPVERMLQPTPAVWQEGLYDDNGKWMDGWESRRKRVEGHDFAVLRLGVPGSIKGVDIDTRFFTGNYPPSASLEACFIAGGGDPDDATAWSEVLPAVALQGDSQHLHAIDDERPWTHLRLNIYPDGGVARLRVYGLPYRDWSAAGTDSLDLAAALNGGRALACSDEHYGSMSNILSPGRAENMGGGWETARRRTPGFDWVIVQLGHPGVIEEVLVDTLHYKGNYPDSCSLQAAYVQGGTDAQIETQSLFWRELLPSQKLQMDCEQRFAALSPLGPVTHVRLNIFPDGGVSRLRLFGKPAR